MSPPTWAWKSTGSDAAKHCCNHQPPAPAHSRVEGLNLMFRGCFEPRSFWEPTDQPVWVPGLGWSFPCSHTLSGWNRQQSPVHDWGSSNSGDSGACPQALSQIVLVHKIVQHDGLQRVQAGGHHLRSRGQNLLPENWYLGQWRFRWGQVGINPHLCEEARPCLQAASSVYEPVRSCVAS